MDPFYTMSAFKGTNINVISEGEEKKNHSIFWTFKEKLIDMLFSLVACFRHSVSGEQLIGSPNIKIL